MKFLKLHLTLEHDKIAFFKCATLVKRRHLSLLFESPDLLNISLSSYFSSMKAIVNGTPRITFFKSSHLL
jgi:hypothetical protein